MIPQIEHPGDTEAVFAPVVKFTTVDLDEFVHSLSVYRSRETTDRDIQQAMYAALGLVGEAGEYSEKVKKWFRDGAINREEAAKELGDVLFYLVASAHHMGYSFVEIRDLMIEKLTSRQKRGTIHGSGDNR